MPRSAAFLATRPAASITDGLLVFVHEVMAAMTMSPCVRSLFTEPMLRRPVFFNASSLSAKPRSSNGLRRSASNCVLTSARRMRSCGRLGPATDGSTDPRSSSIVSV